MSKRAALLILLGIIILGGYFRFFEITSIPLGLYPDEATNGNNALEAIKTGQYKTFYPENNGREGLFINLQSLSVRLFGNEPWALRIVSAFFGTLTILGVYLLAKELFISYRSTELIALLSAFFLATSFWHLNFSRIGFRAIMVPFLAAFGTYFLLKGLRKGTHWEMVLAGIFIGFGFHTYIAFRFMPFVLAVPVLWYLWHWRKENLNNNLKTENTCFPCLILLFVFVTFVVALPMGYYFLQHPEDFLGRTGQVSIFSAESPLFELVKSAGATLQMFFFKGDCNWRHNYNCHAHLYWPVAVFFAAGALISLRSLFSRSENHKIQTVTLLAWLFFMSMPAVLTREGIPHALRSVGIIPAVMILAGLGVTWLWEKITEWVERQKIKYPKYVHGLERIQKELALLAVLLLVLLPFQTFKTYFIRWAHHPETYFAFSTDLLHLGQYLAELPLENKKYVVVNLPGVEVRGIPAPAQTVMFSSNTFQEADRKEKNLTYVLPSDIEKIEVSGKTIIALLRGEDLPLVRSLQKKFPELKAKAPRDFVVLEN